MAGRWPQTSIPKNRTVEPALNDAEWMFEFGMDAGPDVLDLIGQLTHGLGLVE